MDKKRLDSLLKDCNDNEVWELLAREDVRRLIRLVECVHLGAMEEFINNDTDALNESPVRFIARYKRFVRDWFDGFSKEFRKIWADGQQGLQI